MEFATSLSEVGMGLATRREFEIGERLRVRWSTDEFPGEATEARGEVVHARASGRSDADYEVGVSFSALSERTRHLVRSQVAALLAALGCVEDL